MVGPLERTQKLKAKALELGFELSGATPAAPSADYPYFLEWLQKGYAGEMGYLERRKAERGRPDAVLPGARFLFCVALSYNPAESHYPLLEKNPISCYAWGRDYHEVLGEKLEKLCAYLRELVPDCRAKWYVDTGPILEKSYAAAAGLGWIGKNTLLLNKKFGSFLFLGEILTDAELTPDEPSDNFCRTCTACLDACPTGALEEAGVLNANKCISYLTLEHRSPFPAGAPELKGYLAGCDLCQTACPYNTQAPSGHEEAFKPRAEILSLTLEQAKTFSNEQFKSFTRHSALERVKYPMWKRNVSAEENI
jgi:epoxyqueuosine reductase